MAKIAFVSDAAYPWNVGGLETLERREAEALAKEHDVHFFSMKWPGMHKDFVDGGIHYHTFHETSTSKFYRHRRRSIRQALAFCAGCLKLFGQRFDIVQSNQFPILQLPMLKIYCMLYRSKLVIDVHEVWTWGYWTTYLGKFIGGLAYKYSRFALKLGDHYIANSTITASGLEGIGVEKERISVFSPVIDDQAMKSIKASAKSRTIVFAGRLIKEKRLDLWLGVFKEIREKVAVNGIIIGEGPEEGRLARMIRIKGLSSSVELRHFYKDKNNLYKILKNASILLQMSEREGLSMITLESIALGTPVLLPSYTPIPKDLTKMCRVADQDDLPGIAIKILKSKKKEYAADASGVENFYVSRISHFYSALFKKMKIRGS